MFTYFVDSTGLPKLVMDDFYTMRNSLTSLLGKRRKVGSNYYYKQFYHCICKPITHRTAKPMLIYLFDKGDCLHVFVYVWTPSAEIWHSNTFSPADCIAEVPAPGVKRPLNSW